MAYVAEGVLLMYGDPWVVESAGGERQEFLCRLHDTGVDLHHVYTLYLGIFQQFAYHAAVSCAEDEYPARIGMYGHRDMGHHLVVDELVLLGHHDVSVGSEYLPVFGRFEDVYPVVVVLF